MTDDTNWDYIVKSVLFNADLRRARAERDAIADSAWAYDVDRATLTEKVEEWKAKQ